MLSRIISYIKFLISSTNAHGVQSPFVFDLVRKCFYDRTVYSEYELLQKYRKELLTDARMIEIMDFGAGSAIFTSNRRKISSMASNAGISGRRAKLLLRIVRHFEAKNVLELGTSLGLATVALASGHSVTNVLTIEGCPQTAKTADEYFKKFGFQNITLLVSAFDDALINLQASQYDLIYFDGNHRKDATLNYFNALLPTAHNDSVWIFDDINWSDDMRLAWEAIKKHPSVRVTIDTYQWGFVFFRNEQAKEHFVVRA